MTMMGFAVKEIRGLLRLGGAGDRSRHEVVDRLARALEPARRGLGTDRQAFDMDEGDVIEADKTQYRAQIGLLEVQAARRALAAVDAAPAGDDEDLLALEQPLGTRRGVAEGSPGAGEVVDPRLQGRRDRKVVHRRGDDDDIRRLDLRDNRVGAGGDLALTRRALFLRERPGGNGLLGQMRHRLRTQAALDHGRTVMRLAPGSHELGADLARLRLQAEHARGDKENPIHRNLHDAPRPMSLAGSEIVWRTWAFADIMEIGQIVMNIIGGSDDLCSIA